MQDVLLFFKVESCRKEGREHDPVERDDPLCRTGSVILGKLESDILKCCS
jgi:hypothetical protein